jgi:Arc/MetJ family transcription regulator
MIYMDVSMTKHLVDIDDQTLAAAKAALGAATIKETVNQALLQVGGEREATVKRSLDALARSEIAPREQAWR